jgi:hypothetical protein
VYLFGVDLGYKDPERHHSKDTAYFNELKEKVNHKKFNTNRRVDGNFGDKVYVNHVFDWARTSMEYALRRRESDSVCYNCSDGVKIEGAEPLRIEDINLDKEFDKQAFNDLVKNRDFRSTTKYETMKRSLQVRGKVLCDMIDYFTDSRFLELELTPKNIIEIMYRNYMHLMSHDGSQDIYAMRMASGSLTYMQIAILGFIFTIRTDELRSEFGKEALALLHEYLQEMKFIFENEFLIEG